MRVVNPSATREELRAILRAHLARDSATRLRQFLVHLLAMLGGLIVADALFPDLASQAVRQALLWMWAFCFFTAVASAAIASRLQAQEAQLLARSHLSESLSAGDRG